MQSRRIRKCSRLLLILFCCFNVALANTSVSVALDEAFYSGNDILFYNPDSGACSSVGSQSSVSVTTSGGYNGQVTMATANIEAGARDRFKRAMDLWFLKHKSDFIAMQQIKGDADLDYKDYKTIIGVGPKYGGGKAKDKNALRIAWNNTVWEKTSEGTEKLLDHSDAVGGYKENRYATWGTFKHRASGGAISVISTHWNAPTTGREGIAKKQGGVLKNLATKLSASGPVLIGGDFNYQRGGADENFSPHTILDTAGLKPTVKPKESNLINVDYIFVPKNTKIDKNTIIPRSEVEGKEHVSDHPFLISAVTLSSTASPTSISSDSAGASGDCVCQQPSTTTANISGTGTNKDYKGETILFDAQLKAIQDNMPFYEAGAAKAGIPWQVIAGIHYRETRLKRYNPPNGNGPYQILGTKYPPSDTVSDADFKKQTEEAAEFIKGKVSDKDSLRSGDIGVVKDAFFGYNGRASVYAEQAKKLGFDEPYEGSPYVMNKADAIRDPASAKPGTWGQIKADGGGIGYPANTDYGAFVVFGSLAGISSTDSCQTSPTAPIASRVVELAEQELKLWEGGALKPGTDYHKYSQGRSEAWCAHFVSWLYNQAGYPLREGNEGNVAAVNDIMGLSAIDKGKFEWHDIKSGYVPRPGDIHVQKNEAKNVSHVSLVVAVDGGKVTKIGGNQQGNGRGPNASKVTKDNWMEETVGYVSPKGGE